MSHPWLPHLPLTMSTSSSSPMYPTTHREHSVHPAHLQAPSVDKLRPQESLWREDLQSGETSRAISTDYEPKDLATVSRIEACSGDPYQLYDVQEKVGEENLRALITEEAEECREIGTVGLSDSKISETSYFRRRCISTIPWKALQILISKMRVTKRWWHHHCTPRKLRETRCNGHAGEREREVSAQNTQTNRKESLRSHSSDGQNALEKPNALFSSEQGNLIRSFMFRDVYSVEFERMSSWR